MSPAGVKRSHSTPSCKAGRDGAFLFIYLFIKKRYCCLHWTNTPSPYSKGWRHHLKTGKTNSWKAVQGHSENYWRSWIVKCNQCHDIVLHQHRRKVLPASMWGQHDLLRADLAATSGGAIASFLLWMKGFHRTSSQVPGQQVHWWPTNSRKLMKNVCLFSPPASAFSHSLVSSEGWLPSSLQLGFH